MLRLLERRAHLLDRLRPQHARAEALRVRGEIRRQRREWLGIAVEAERAFRAVPVERAEPVEAERARERADRREPAVIDEHDDELGVLLDRRDDLARHHEVAAVADHDEHLALGCREFHADAGGYLVAHARVAVLDVVLLRIARAPQLVQLAGQRARGADDDVLRTCRLVHGADHLALGRQRPVASTVRRVHGAVPLGLELGDLAPVRVVDTMIDAHERLEDDARIADDLQAAELRRVELCDVDVREAHPRTCEERVRSGGEVAPARADADDEIRVGGEPIGGG